MSSTSDVAEYIRSNFSGEAWQVTHTDDVDRKVYVEAPRAIVNLSEALTEIQEETGATCDLELTTEGATLTFWAPSTWEKPAASSRASPWWSGLALAAGAVVLAGAAVVVSPSSLLLPVRNMTLNQNSEASDEQWSIW